MSKSTGKKVSTALRENAHVEHSVFPPVFSSSVLTSWPWSSPELHRTLDSSMTSSWTWWMSETLCCSNFCLRMNHRCSLLFRSSCTVGHFTLSSLSSAGQGSYQRCVWGHHDVEYTSVCPVSEGRGSCFALVWHNTNMSNRLVLVRYGSQ